MAIAFSFLNAPLAKVNASPYSARQQSTEFEK